MGGNWQKIKLGRNDYTQTSLTVPNACEHHLYIMLVTFHLDSMTSVFVKIGSIHIFDIGVTMEKWESV